MRTGDQSVRCNSVPAIWRRAIPAAILTLCGAAVLAYSGCLAAAAGAGAAGGYVVGREQERHDR